ncbi:uncharacterized protein LOC114033737 [Vombatus ursinus]|uniref:uncharacterized protein LOC114033737 n=1 Tax=Vombatus ursinus TaxID=29139 RepID=UPI000FFD9E82|nr:uncharacterized protein LOC114033737 [Vombatus ursinus]
MAAYYCCIWSLEGPATVISALLGFSSIIMYFHPADTTPKRKLIITGNINTEIASASVLTSHQDPQYQLLLLKKKPFFPLSAHVHQTIVIMGQRFFFRIPSRSINTHLRKGLTELQGLAARLQRWLDFPSGIARGGGLRACSKIGASLLGCYGNRVFLPAGSGGGILLLACPRGGALLLGCYGNRVFLLAGIGRNLVVDLLRELGPAAGLLWKQGLSVGGLQGCGLGLAAGRSQGQGLTVDSPLGQQWGQAWPVACAGGGSAGAGPCSAAEIAGLPRGPLVCRRAGPCWWIAPGWEPCCRPLLRGCCCCCSWTSLPSHPSETDLSCRAGSRSVGSRLTDYQWKLSVLGTGFVVAVGQLGDSG